MAVAELPVLFLGLLKSMLSAAEAIIVAVPGLVLIGVVIYALMRTRKGSSGARAAERSAEEARIIQDVYHGLEKMERRIEALETILLEKGMKE